MILRKIFITNKIKIINFLKKNLAINFSKTLQEKKQIETNQTYNKKKLINIYSK